MVYLLRQGEAVIGIVLTLVDEIVPQSPAAQVLNRDRNRINRKMREPIKYVVDICVANMVAVVAGGEHLWDDSQQLLEGVPVERPDVSHVTRQRYRPLAAQSVTRLI
jgi:hypothetical protein